MPFGSRRFLTGRSINPVVTTISFGGGFGVGSTTPQNMRTATISGDTAGNTLNGNGTYTTSGGAGGENIAAGIVSSANCAICVPLTEQRNYIMRISRVEGENVSSPNLGTINATASGTGIFASAPQIHIKYDRIFNNSGTLGETGSPTSLLVLTNHDTNADVTIESDTNVYTHWVDFSNTVTEATYTFQTGFNVAENDNDTAEGGFTPKGIYITYSVQNSGSGAGGGIDIQLQQA
tara:strand:- start:863 stop:1567 length:705 start_codon:yes stop_codon:yes gene_type:complete